MKKIIYISFLTLVLGVSSCSDYLEKEPSYTLNDQNAINDLEKAKNALGGVYQSFATNTWSGQYYVDLALKSGFIRWEDSELYDLDYSPVTSNGDTQGFAFWNNFYISVNNANFAITGATNLPEAVVNDEAQHKSVIAEGRCLRAWINANILWNFGHWWSLDDANPYGIMYRDEVVNLDNVQQARLNIGDSYAKIFEDLDYAIENLNNYDSPRYVSKEFAKVIKAKLILYRSGYNDSTEDLDEALNLINEVLNTSSNFKMQEDLAKVYQDSWDSNENLFALYLDDNGARTRNSSTYSGFVSLNGDRLPVAPEQTTAGLEFGLDWFKADPRWDIVTGPVRDGNRYNNTYYHTWSKVARFGGYEGLQQSPPDEKYTAYYFRYPELYIMKAELLARTGASVMDAIAPINEMRSLRTNPVLSELSPSTQEELMDMIFQEYFLETFLENGSEFFASLRFKKNGKPWIETIKNGKTLEENKICYPIPSQELIANLLMKQNPE
ncbi:RagB/SusD family nutrient uptake outer membrane protein [Thalassobellus citreus]|uniref:RagB/SusD family nutrient uptake outer membrane protein n=1 Tax=Thalassobellus citreus TaxID=3367752 RepID=UPI00379A1938